jgi:hypothetical protein
VNQAAPDLVVARNEQVCLDARTRIDVAELVCRSVAVMGGEEIDISVPHPARSVVSCCRTGTMRGLSMSPSGCASYYCT